MEYKNLSAAELVDSLEGEEDTLQGSHFPFQSLSSPSLPSQEKGKKQGSGEEIGKEGFNDRMMKVSFFELKFKWNHFLELEL